MNKMVEHYGLNVKQDETMLDWNGKIVIINKTPVILSDRPFIKTLHLLKNKVRLNCSKLHWGEFLSIEGREFYETKKCKKCFTSHNRESVKQK